MAKMYKNQYTVTVKTKGGNTATFADSTAEGAGAAALQALEAGMTIDAMAGENRTIIPFDAVDMATVAFTRTEVDKPADPTCE